MIVPGLPADAGGRYVVYWDVTGVEAAVVTVMLYRLKDAVSSAAVGVPITTVPAWSEESGGRYIVEEAVPEIPL